MLFHTWTFALFFLVVYLGYLALKGTRLKLPWLLFWSYFFYGWWNPLYLLLILWSTTVDYLAVVGMAIRRGERPQKSYFVGGWLNPLYALLFLYASLIDWLALLRLVDSRSRKPWLALSIANNLGLLGFFKYGGFVVQNLNALLASLGVPYEIPPPGVLLPVGISFYVFQSMSYTIDYYRGNVEREPSFIRYATFVSLFPQLVAGPIERAKNLLPQLRHTPRISRRDVADGLSLLVVGLFKKVALADYLALYVDPIYEAPERFQAPALILATFAFAWQIYFDFSGYTDMARGVARMMGIRLMLNFNNPYLATGLGDFWRRWHISLSTWFKDYVYIPLGGNRKGEVRTYVNMCLTMVISGLWHGAMWTFVVWGALHAVGYSLTRSLERTFFYGQQVPRFVKQVLTFSFVTFAWIFFRAESFGDAWLIVGRIFQFGRVDPRCPLLLVGLILAVWVYQFIYESKLRWTLAPAPVRMGLVVLMLLYVAVVGGSGEEPFIYFQF
ncbi:MAG: MBOAT family O-acyltransferase [Planctomycetota bacterium]|jgi:D-alanyl-lipoteichoic acid acyltransferase DltB (MBOAT superfamily)